ncbi:MAG: outer membrane beta-barrel protein [Tidjanibacter sp.]|nr:outer membrane beta-barrel protein [Tidjanibacter sp.]MBQ1964027.1 outer membrane beta-barrel protein [Tidjanibacter sp.]
MKKILITILALLAVASSAVAQNYEKAREERKQYFVFGPKAGLSMPYQNVVTNTTDIKSLLWAPNVGIQLGGYLRGVLPIKRTPVVLYMQLDALWAMDIYAGSGQSAFSGVVNMPLLIGGGYKLSKTITLRGGWGPSYTINCVEKANTNFKGTDNGYQSEVADLIRRDPWGWTGDIGADIKNWSVDLRLQNQFRSREYKRIADETRFISYGITVGYRF